MTDEKDTVWLTTAYWGPVQYYSKLFRYRHVVTEQFDHYTKQTYRNRCVIASPDGPLALTVPTVKYEGLKCPMKDIRISDHGNWRHLHWNALESAYRNSPFFEYYADDFRPFYEKKWEFLLDFNLAIQDTVCRLVDLAPQISRSDQFLDADAADAQGAEDCRFSIHPRVSFEQDAHFEAVPYYQVFSDRIGFLPNLSMADLLFNMGPESLLVLQACCK